MHPSHLLKVKKSYSKQEKSNQSDEDIGKQIQREEPVRKEETQQWKVPPVSFDHTEHSSMSESEEEDSTEDEEIAIENIDESDNSDEERFDEEDRNESNIRDDNSDIDSVVQQLNRLSVAEDLNILHEVEEQQKSKSKV